MIAHGILLLPGGPQTALRAKPPTLRTIFRS
jgi:hypothetical protein